MKTVSWLVLLALGIGGYLILRQPAEVMPSVQIPETEQREQKSAIQEEVAEPLELEIPKLGIRTNIEKVGEDKDGRMAVPSLPENVSWWGKGSKPGEVGSAVLAGHLDDERGDEAVFAHLADLTRGDMIKIRTGDGVTLVFEVERTATYLDSEFPLERVFADQDGQYLNLITCAGEWDQTEANYLERYVVFSKLREKEIGDN